MFCIFGSTQKNYYCPFCVCDPVVIYADAAAIDTEAGHKKGLSDAVGSGFMCLNNSEDVPNNDKPINRNSQMCVPKDDQRLKRG